ncbi:MAG: helix-turn-helix domain-containing protein [Chloroflexales bacterium]|nr:helix-turn-helix domain-containing protein [Chloroflexales bacterium]
MLTTIQKTYRYRIKPTPAQAALFVQFAGARRWVWNWSLGKRRAHHKATGKHLSSPELYAERTRLKREPGYEWLRLMDRQALQQAIRDQDKAYTAFFKDRAERTAGKKGGRVVGPPRFKSRKRSPLTCRIPQRVTFRRDRLAVPKVGQVGSLGISVKGSLFSGQAGARG